MTCKCTVKTGRLRILRANERSVFATGSDGVRNRRLRIAGLVLPFALAMSGAGCTSLPDDDGFASPREVFQAEHEATRALDYDAMVKCVDPDRRAPVRRMMKAAKPYLSSYLAAERLIEQRLGKEAALAFRETHHDPRGASPFEEAVEGEQVRWDRIRIHVEGDKAQAVMEGSTLCRAVRKPNGRWYMALTESEVGPEAVAFARGLGEDGLRQMEDVIQKVKGGLLTKDDLLRARAERLAKKKEEEARRARWAATPYGPAVDGVSIRLITSSAVFGKDRPKNFIVDVKHTTDEAVGWWVPGRGPHGSRRLGENIILRIDGKTVKQPDVKASNFCPSNPRGGRVTRMLLRLPSTLKLSPGKHTIQYTIINHGGTHTVHGQEYRVLKGRLVSSILSFIVAE